MTDMERNFLRKRRTKLEERFKGRYAAPFTVDGQLCFQARNNYFFLVTGLRFPEDGAEAIVLEFADTLDAAKRNIFEDADLYYMDEMNEEEMFQAMVKEIEDE